MSSLVLELQQDALNPKVSVSDLLRKALVVAKKLGVQDLEIWVQNELKGYAKVEDIPGYRKIRGEPQAFNPYYGWRPISFPDSKTLELVATKPCDQSIAEIETIAKSGAGDGTLGMNFAPEQEAMLRKAIGMNLQICLIVQLSSITKILDAVRNAVLEWSLKLEQDGIHGEGMTFTPEEKKAAGRAAYNITNFFGPVHSSQIQHGTQHSVQIQASGLNLGEVAKFIDVLKGQAEALPLSSDGKAELAAEIKTIETQLSSPKPKAAVLRESLHSVRNILEGMGAGIAVELLKQLGPLLAAFSP